MTDIIEKVRIDLEIGCRAPEEVYLGDGVSAKFRGDSIVLRTAGDNVIFLEPGVFSRLVAYVKGLELDSRWKEELREFVDLKEGTES